MTPGDKTLTTSWDGRAAAAADAHECDDGGVRVGGGGGGHPNSFAGVLTT